MQNAEIVSNCTGYPTTVYPAAAISTVTKLWHFSYKVLTAIRVSVSVRNKILILFVK